MDEEVWKTIPISTNYEASTHGRIRNKKTGRVLKSCKSVGYRKVGIKGTNRETITKLVHRLVAITFIENPENKATVNHKEHGKSNNHTYNLEWSSHKEQANHSRKRKLTTDEMGFEDTWGKRRIWKCDNKNGDRLEMFETIRDAACSLPSSKLRMAQINTVAEGHEISKSMPGSRQSAMTASGYKWEFDELRVLTTERWRDVEQVHTNGVEGYQISTLGRLCNPEGKVKSPYGPGYPSFHPGGKKKQAAHRLVALTFIDRVDGKDYVNHLDGNKNNPVVDNLEWVTLSENSRHAHATGLVVSPTTKLLQFDLEGKFVKEYESAKTVMAEFGPINIYHSINTSSSAGGYIWKRETYDKDRVVKWRKREYSRKKVKQHDLNGVFIKEFDSIRAAEKEVPGLRHDAINKKGSSRGFKWKYSTDTSPFKKQKRTHTTKVNQFDLDMNFVARHESIAAALVQVPGASVYWANKNTRPSKGFYWKYF